MKRIFYFLSFLLFASHAIAQDSASSKSITWNFSATGSAQTGYQLNLRADIQPGWKLFSTTMKDEDPNTRVRLDSASAGFASIISVIEKPTAKSAIEPLLGDLAIKYFENSTELIVNIKSTQQTEDITGVVIFMAIKGDVVIGPEEIPFRFSFDQSGNLIAKAGGLQQSATGSAALKRTAIDVDNPASPCGGTGAEDSGSKSLWGIFVLGFLGGLVGLIMPCTFPMIPLTVSFFTKKSGTKSKGIFNAFLYGFFIFLIYILLSVPFYFLSEGSSDILNNISTNAWLNLVFTAIFVIFAISFFGYFEITLPSRFSNTADSKSNVGSVGGIFFMALTLAIVSFSCTGPILGSLLVGALSQSGGAIQLTFAMAGFGLALGLPFALFALFPNWLSSLPRSGGWMNTVKIVFGFVELALALKFLSNADLVEHWGILKREPFFAIWIAIALGLVLYLFGILKFKHDPPPKKLGWFRITTAILFLSFAVYLAPGLTNTKYANRALVSGFPPPLDYSIYKKEKSEIHIINDYDKALQMAKQLNKPILIDFTGWACVNCRKMEENVWPKEEVKELISKNYILLSLYVDDRKVLPAKEQFFFDMPDGSKKAIKTVGDKFITMQSVNFKNASQPLYAVISPEEKLLTLPVGYTPNVKEYADWLRCGLK